jgi:hypothetical protein
MSSQSSEDAAGMCAGHIFVIRRNDRPKCAKRLSTRRSFSDVFQHGSILLLELNIDNGSGFRDFVRMTKSDFETLPQKIGPRIQKKDTKFGEEIPASIKAAVTLKYLASGDFFSISVVLIPNSPPPPPQENQSHFLAITVSAQPAQCTSHKTCIGRQILNSFIRPYVSPSNSANKQQAH